MKQRDLETSIEIFPKTITRRLANAENTIGEETGEHCLSNETLETLKEEKRAQLRKDVDIVDIVGQSPA